MSLVDALFPGTRQKVLGLLFGQPWRDFSVSELIALADAGSGAVQRELKRLGEAELVVVHAVGNQRRVQANEDSPIFAELCAIIRKTVGVSGELREALRPLSTQMTFALLFGSVAKGTDTAESDIDLLVVSDELTMEALFAALEGAEQALGRSVQPTLYTSAEFQSRRDRGSPFLSSVLGGETVMLWGALDG